MPCSSDSRPPSATWDDLAKLVGTHEAIDSGFHANANPPHIRAARRWDQTRLIGCPNKVIAWFALRKVRPTTLSMSASR